MLAGGVSRWVSGNSTYLMQWAAVRTQFWATRVPPQVWRHWPLELNCRETWGEAWVLW